MLKQKLLILAVLAMFQAPTLSSGPRAKTSSNNNSILLKSCAFLMALCSGIFVIWKEYQASSTLTSTPEHQKLKDAIQQIRDGGTPSDKNALDLILSEKTSKEGKNTAAKMLLGIRNLDSKQIDTDMIAEELILSEPASCNKVEDEIKKCLEEDVKGSSDKKAYKGPILKIKTPLLGKPQYIFLGKEKNDFHMDELIKEILRNFLGQPPKTTLLNDIRGACARASTVPATLQNIVVDQIKTEKLLLEKIIIINFHILQQGFATDNTGTAAEKAAVDPAAPVVPPAPVVPVIPT